jgi:hypothetical protein
MVSKRDRGISANILRRPKITPKAEVADICPASAWQNTNDGRLFDLVEREKPRSKDNLRILCGYARGRGKFAHATDHKKRKVPEGFSRNEDL